MKIITLYRIAISFIIGAMILTAPELYAQGGAASVSKSVVSSGAVVQTGSCILQATLGQSVIGSAISAAQEGRFGFWYVFNTHSTSVEQHFVALPIELRVQVYPNPICANATIGYSLSENAEVQLSIFDITGRAVWTFYEGVRMAGDISLAWDGCNSTGAPLPAGIYCIAVQARSLRSGLRTTTTAIAGIAK